MALCCPCYNKTEKFSKVKYSSPSGVLTGKLQQCGCVSMFGDHFLVAAAGHCYSSDGDELLYRQVELFLSQSLVANNTYM